MYLNVHIWDRNLINFLRDHAKFVGRASGHMGRTMPTFRFALEAEISSWKEFRRGLRPEDRPLFDLIMDFGRSHGDAGSLAARLLVSENIFLSALIEQQKQIIALKHELSQLHLQSEASGLEKVEKNEKR